MKAVLGKGWIKIPAIIAAIILVLGFGCKLSFHEDLYELASAKSRFVASVVISPGSGEEYQFTITGIPSVEIACAESAAQIFYAIDGGVFSPYAGPFSLSVANPKAAQTITVSAYATHPEYETLPTVSQVYSFVPTQANAPEISPSSLYYEFNGASVPVISLSSDMANAEIYYVVTGMAERALYTGPFPLPLPADTSVPSPVTLSAYVSHPDYLDSPESTQVYQYVTWVPSPQITPQASPSVDFTVNSVPTVAITCAQDGSAILYSVNSATVFSAYPGAFAVPLPADTTVPSDVVIRAYATHAGYTDSSVASQTYHFIPTVLTPTVAPVPSGDYQYGLPPTVTLACAQSGATIHYSVDSTSAYGAYSSPFPVPVPADWSVARDIVIRAYATAAGFADSLVASQTYHFIPTVPAPIFASAPLSYYQFNAPPIVVLSCSQATATIHYSVDSTTVYNAYVPPLTVPVPLAPWLANQDIVIRAYASEAGYADSPVVSATYRFLISGTMVTLAGTGASGYSGDGGDATLATLNSPTGVCADAAGNVYIADTGNHCIRKITLDGRIVNLAGTPEISGDNADGVSGTSARLNTPTSVTTNDTVLYISDTNNHRIREIPCVGGTITTFAGTGDGDFFGEGVNRLLAHLNGPNGLTLDNNDKNLYIADTGNNRIRRIIIATGLIETLAGNGVSGFSPDGTIALAANLASPRGMGLRLSNKLLYIADTGNHCIRVMDLKLGSPTLSSVCGVGTTAGSSPDGTASGSLLTSPARVCVDNAAMYFTDTGTHRIRMINEPTLSTIAGIRDATVPVVDRVSATASALNTPCDVFTVNGQGWYVADTLNNRIVKILNY